MYFSSWHRAGCGVSEPTARPCACARANNELGSGHSNILKNREKIPKNTIISILIDQFSCKNWPIKDGGCL
jgi:hypothetical protein